MSGRRLVVTADDFGLTPEVNAGVAAAHRDGIVTSASLMVRRPAAAAAAALAADLPALSVGLHVELASWTAVDGRWVASDRVVDPDDPDAVTAELHRQLDRFEALVGAPPAHLDSHHHLHRDGPLAVAAATAADRLGIPLRDGPDARYVGGFYGQYGTGAPWPEGITVDALVELLGGLAPGASELACHPATGPHPDHGTYDAERAVELATLCDPRVRAALGRSGVELVASRDLRRR